MSIAYPDPADRHSHPHHSLGRPTPSESHRRLEHLLDVASELFLEQGYERTSMESIARRAGSSKQTIYSHFTTKADLFAAVFRRRADAFFGNFVRVLKEETSTESGLRGFASQLIEIVADPQAIALRRMVIGETRRFPELLSEFLRKRAAAGELRVEDSTVAAQQFASLVTAGAVWAADLGLETPFAEEPVTVRVDRAVSAFLKLYSST
jgi:TetR/AcrR family transcriptional repressor of mexJK operon